MDLYHSRLTPYDLNDLIIKYKIPHDLHPRLPSEDFVVSELPDDAIGSTSLNKRHPDAAIDDPRPVAGSFNMDDVRRLSAHVIKLREMPEGVLVLSGLTRVWKSRICDPVLQGADRNVMGIHDFLCLPELPFYCTSPAAVDVVIPNPTLEDLVVGTLSSNILAKDEASQKRKASTSSTTLSHVAKCTRSALAQSSGITIRPSLFVGDSDDESDGDDDACVEIPLVTPLRSAAVISSLRNQDSRGKGIMVDDAATPSIDAIHADFFPFYAGPYYATYPQYGVARNYKFTREEWDDPYRPTFGVLTKEVFKDPAICKLWLKGYEEKSKAKGKERKKKIKSLTKSLDNLYAEVARLSVAINQATVLEA
ncbi:hypothetical protein Tco_0403437 [Tanacetum coccineum]